MEQVKVDTEGLRGVQAAAGRGLDQRVVRVVRGLRHAHHQPRAIAQGQARLPVEQFLQHLQRQQLNKQ